MGPNTGKRPEWAEDSDLRTGPEMKPGLGKVWGTVSVRWGWGGRACFYEEG